MNKNCYMQKMNVKTGEFEHLHPETNWEQVKVSKDKNLKQLLYISSVDVAALKHDLHKIPMYQVFEYENGFGIGALEEYPVGGTNLFAKNNSMIEFTSFDEGILRLSDEYESYGDVNVEKHPQRPEFYITFSLSNKCVCVIFS